MYFSRKKMTEKGETNLRYVVLGILITVSVLAAAKYIHDRDNGAVIQLPKVDVH